MELEISLPCSHEPTTRPYPERHESGPHPPILSFKNNFNIILTFTPKSSICAFPTNNYYFEFV
jgi:hypothetical protein